MDGADALPNSVVRSVAVGEAHHSVLQRLVAGCRSRSRRQNCRLAGGEQRGSAGHGAAFSVGPAKVRRRVQCCRWRYGQEESVAKSNVDFGTCYLTCCGLPLVFEYASWPVVRAYASGRTRALLLNEEKAGSVVALELSPPGGWAEERPWWVRHSE